MDQTFFPVRAVPTTPEPRVYGSHEAWRERFARAAVRLQWDPEYSLRDAKLDDRSIQVGLSRDIIARYANDWTVEIRDLTPLVHEMSAHLRGGHIERAEALLPHEGPYPLDDALAKTVGAG